MAKKSVMELNMKGTGIKRTTKDVEKTRKETEKLDKSRNKLSKSTDKYSRREKGAAQMGMNSTKSFSKMQQGIGGEGGSGGLVRAYALLAANVFALSAAFGILSRSAQIDTLVESMERLEIVTGNAVKAMARNLQEAAGYGLDFAESMRSTSLALSAGFDSSTIQELGEVAKNAAVSLGRPIADSLDRIFRGVIKVEPELLDEIGLFVRVREASARYASSLGVAATELTEFQKRQAFATESVRQGREKFEEFSDIEIDAFALLAASFSDMSQSVLTFINRGLGPMIKFLAENKELLGAAFGAIAIMLLRKAIPAMGLFTRSIQQQASDASAAHAKYVQEVKTKAQIEREEILETMALREKSIQKEIAGQQAARRATDKARSYKGGAKLKSASAEIKDSVQGEKRIAALKQKQVALNASMRDSTRASIMEEQAALEAEIAMEQQLLALKQEQKAITSVEVQTGGKNKLAQLTTAKLARKEIIATGIANVTATAETHGFWAALKSVGRELKLMGDSATLAGTKISWFSKALFVARSGVVALQVAVTALAMRLMAFFGWIMVLIPVITFFLKKLGLWDAAYKSLQKKTEAMNELMDSYGDKMKHNTKVLKDQEAPIGKLQQAQLALSRTVRDTAKAIIAAREELKEYKKEATLFASWWLSAQTKMGFGPEADVQSSETTYFEGLIDQIDVKSTGMQKLLKNTSFANRVAIDQLLADKQKLLAQDKRVEEAHNKLQAERQRFMNEAGKAGTVGGPIGAAWQTMQAYMSLGKRLIIEKQISREEEKRRKMGEAYNDLGEKTAKNLVKIHGLMGKTADLAKLEAAGAENLLSIQKGAQDALREYRDKFIVKTDVDKPLAIFEQTAANIMGIEGKTAVSTEERKLFLDKIAEKGSEIRDLMSDELEIRYLATESESKRIDILKEQRDLYLDQQRILIQNEDRIKNIGKVQKLMNALIKESAPFAKLNMKMDQEKLKLAIESKELGYKNFLSQHKMTRTRFEELQIMGDQTAAMKEWKDLGDTSQSYLSAVVKFRNIEIQKLEQKIQIETESARLTKATAEIDLKRLNTQEKINQAHLTRWKIQKQLESFRTKGTTTLSGADSIEAVIKAEETRLKTAKEKAKIEKIIITAQYDILKIEAQLLQKRAELYGDESVNLDAIIDNLTLAGQALVHVIDDGLSNAADEFVKTLADELGKLDLLEGLETYASVDRLIKQLDSIKGVGFLISKWTGMAADRQPDRDAAEKRRANAQRVLDKIEATDKGRFGRTQLITAWSEKVRIATEEVAVLDGQIAALDAQIFIAKVGLMTQAMLQFAESVKSLGPEGEAAAALANFSANILTAFTNIKFGFDAIDAKKITEEFTAMDAKLQKTALVLQGVSTIISGIASVMAADTKAKTAAIDQQIALEKKLDGKSEESVGKIKAMEAKKDQIKRKAFETNKKLQIANAIVSTAAGAAMAMSLGPWGVPLAAMILALGAAQIAIIRKTQYQSTSGLDTSSAQQLDIGTRGDRVDVSRGVSSGELSYLRGGRGVGSNANNFVPGGGAVGLRQGYATGGGILVGEQGPEIVTPTSPVTVTPNETMMGSTNVNFAIHAVDAAGVEDVLRNQRGNIIGMIREAANAYGEDFLEVVDTQVYQPGGD